MTTAVRDLRVHDCGAASPVCGGRAEIDLLLCIARRSLTTADHERLAELLWAEPDWERLQRLAGRHKLLPLLYWHLRGFPGAVPASVLDRLQQYYLDNTRRMLALTAELVAIVQALAAQEILAVPYKGPALGVEAYGDLSLRRAADLDIVVRPGDLPRVRDLLRSRGYRPEHALPAAGRRLMVRGLYHEAFFRQDGHTVEVHWRFTDKQLGFSLGLEALESRLGTIAIGGHEVCCFGREDLLLILCAHGAKHRWEQLECVAAVAELLRASPPPDWTILFDRAAEFGSRRMLFLGLRLAADLLGAPLPPSVHRAVLEDRAVTDLAKAVQNLLYADPTPAERQDSPPRDVFYLSLNERPRDKARFLIHRLTTPSQAKSWRGVRLGRRYFPLHVILRPFSSWRRLWPVARWYFMSERSP